jgi:plastocyanin
MPVLVPVAAFVGGLAIIFLLSRIYLELSNEAATGLSLAIALGILLTAALAASGERMPVLPVGGIVAAAFALLIGFGAWAAISPDEVTHEAAAGGGPTPTAAAPAAPGELVIVAKNVLFDKKELRVPAGEPFTVTMRNDDSGVPHNWALYTDQSASQAIAGANEGICTGPCEDKVEVPALDPGAYFFRCDVHPTQMTGTLIAE